MKKRNDTVVCRQCGKIIVGSSKVGLCEGCFNKDVSGVVGVVGVVGAAASIRIIIKKCGSEIKDLFQSLRK